MEPRGREGEIGIPNLHLAPLFPTPHKGRNSTVTTQNLDPPPLPDPPASSADPKNHSPPPSTDSVRYKECQKNHAVSMGGHVVDGCGEFMPSGDDGTPQALRCAACECHRNFHRKVVYGQTPHAYNPNRQSHLHQHQHAYPHGLATGGVTMVSFGGNSSGGGGGGAAAESSSEDRAAAAASFCGSKKRFRTKFSRDQKDRMHEFARKLGWRMHNQDEQQVQDFCRQVGIKREVFKVWMHNNKQSIKKLTSTSSQI